MLVVGLRAVGLQVSLLILIAGVFAVFVVRRVVAALAPPPISTGSRAPATHDDDATWNWGARDALRTAINGGSGRWTGPTPGPSASPASSCPASRNWPTSGCA
ncbi:hypothetical protein GCM10027614_37910 [Micromonospora vulcania]